MAPAPPPPESVSVGGIPAGYGRSCTNCSRAKCRCILRPEGGKCDRCYRLGKECHQMVTSRKRVAKRTTASRTAQLEEKLDDLVSILRATQQQQHQHHQHHHEAQQPQPPPPLQQQHQHPVHLQKQQQQQQPPAPSPMNGASNSGIPPSASSAELCQPFISRLDSLADAATTSQSQTHASNLTPPLRLLDRLPEPAPSEAEVYLVKFRQWLEFFPFMHLDSDLTAEALQRESPFLWLCIMNVTSMSMPQQAMMRDRLRQEIAQRTILSNERSLELLQGLIILISW